MNVFHRYTRQALRKNRSRTWVTIVGIILSVALFTAVTEGAYSGVRYLIGAAEYTVGRFHGCYQNLTEQQATQLSRDEKEITEQSAWQLVGWGQVGADNAYKPYLRIMSMDPDLPDLLSIRLTQGACRRRPGRSSCRSICGPMAASAMRWGTPWSWSWATGRWVGRS